MTRGGAGGPEASQGGHLGQTTPLRGCRQAALSQAWLHLESKMLRSALLPSFVLCHTKPSNKQEPLSCNPLLVNDCICPMLGCIMQACCRDEPCYCTFSQPHSRSNKLASVPLQKTGFMPSSCQISSFASAWVAYHLSTLFWQLQRLTGNCKT